MASARKSREWGIFTSLVKVSHSNQWDQHPVGARCRQSLFTGSQRLLIMKPTMRIAGKWQEGQGPPGEHNGVQEI